MAVANDIAHWRAQIFARLLLVVFLLGLCTAVPSVLLAASEGMWSIVVVDSLALLWLGVIWRWRALAYTSRVVNFLVIAFMVGIALLLKVGPVSQIYLMAIPVLAALLLGLRPALWTLAIAGLVVFVELWAIAWIQNRYMETPFFRAVIQVVVGGALVLAAGILIGSG